MKKIGIIGTGVVGTAIGVVLSTKGYEITGIYDKTPNLQYSWRNGSIVLLMVHPRKFPTLLTSCLLLPMTMPLEKW